MPFYAFVHPALAVFTLVWGIAVGQVSLAKLAEWDFPLRRVRSRTIVYFLLCVANLGMGLVAAALLAGIGREPKLPLHLVLGIIVCVLALLAALTSFGRSRPGEAPDLMRWHPILVVASLALILTQGFLSGLTLLRL